MWPEAPGRRAGRRQSARPRPAPPQWPSAASPRPAAACGRARISCRRIEFVASAPHHFEMAGPARVALDLLAQAADVDGDRSWAADKMLVPDSVQQIIAAEHFTRVGD